MGAPRAAAPVKLIAGVLAASAALLAEAGAAVAERFGPLDVHSAPALWDVSAYYRDEMGPVLYRQFVSCERLVAADALVDIKLATNRLEDSWRGAAGRQVNLDPGYVGTGKLVLASTKDAAHRVYLGRGVYAEVTLHFHGGTFAPYRFTYPDYAAPAALEFFNGVRAVYLRQLRALR